jgi:hypothetical protein
MSENQEAPPRAKKHFRKVGGVPLTAAITAVTGGLQQHTFAQILSSKFLSVLCLAPRRNVYEVEVNKTRRQTP